MAVPWTYICQAQLYRRRVRGARLIGHVVGVPIGMVSGVLGLGVGVVAS